jgi:hypothetical protein
MPRTARAVGVAVWLWALVGAAGCSSTGSADDAAAGGASGGGGSGGAGGSSGADCPATVPAPGASCSGTAACFYEECAGIGRNVARCVNGAWSVESGPCTGVSCQSQTCAPGQVCVIRAGGALLIDCVQNVCGGTAIACGCLQSCAGTCTVGGSLASGVTIQCNTCPSNLCP